jgi:hypothetical protein
VSRRPVKSLSAITALALALSLSACLPEWFGGGGGASGGTSTPSGSSDGENSAGAATDDGDDDLTPCPYGAWTLVNDSWADTLEQMFAADGTSAQVRVTGTVDMDWNEDDSYVITNRASQYDISGTSGGNPFAMRVLHDGSETGTWSVDASGAYTQVTSGGSVDSVVSLGQSEATLEEMHSETDTPEFFAGSMTIRCSADGLQTTVTDAGASATVDWVLRAP